MEWIRITDAAVSKLARSCVRLRYVDFACLFPLFFCCCFSIPSKRVVLKRLILCLTGEDRLPRTDRSQCHRTRSVDETSTHRLGSSMFPFLSLPHVPAYLLISSTGIQVDRSRHPCASRTPVLAGKDTPVVLRGDLGRCHLLPAEEPAEVDPSESDGRAELSKGRVAAVSKASSSRTSLSFLSLSALRTKGFQTLTMTIRL